MKQLFLVMPLLCGLLISRQAAAQADQVLPLHGGSGGGRFEARCAMGEILNGFELRTGVTSMHVHLRAHLRAE